MSPVFSITGNMGDSQNWSSFEAVETPTKPQSHSTTEPTTEHRGLQSIDLWNLRNRLVFGGLVGFCTGATFGTIDAIKGSHGQINRSAFHTISKGAAMSGGAFAAFFLTYQGFKTILQGQRNQDDYINTSVATVCAGLPFLRSRLMRQNLPYALMLVALDHFHEEINTHRS